MKCLKCRKDLDTDVVYGLHSQCFRKWFNLPKVDEFKDIERKSAASKDPKNDEPFAMSDINSSFFQGKFKKYSAILNGESYILKVKETEFPELPDVEYVCNQIAEELKIPVADHYLIDWQGVRTFVTKNFVRSSCGLLNLNHIYHYLKETDTFDCETLLRVIEDQTKRFIDIDIFVKVCLFDALIGNHDRHGRNLGLLESPKGLQLSPIYDNPSALGLESGAFLQAQFSPKGKIFTKASKEPTLRDYISEFDRLGYSESVQEFCADLDVDKLLEIIDQSSCSDLMKSALKRLIETRAKEITDGF